MKTPLNPARILPVLLLAIAPLPASAQNSQDRNAPPRSTPDKPDKPDRPIGQRDASAVDVLTTPAGDLNLRKDAIPPLLLAAQEDPYTLGGLRRCADISAEVSRFDAVLGDDFDIAQNSDRKMRPGKVAQSVVGSFIPFRGLIREISGASEQERRMQYAIYAGAARRSFLKGIGQQRGCPWPARSATPQVISRIEREAANREAAKEQAKQSAKADRRDR